MLTKSKTEAKEKLGRAHEAAKARAPKEGQSWTAEAKVEFDKLIADVNEAQLEFQRWVAMEKMEEAQTVLDGELTPEIALGQYRELNRDDAPVHGFRQGNSVANLDFGFGDTGLSQLNRSRAQAPRILTHAELRQRYGLTHAQHRDIFRGYLRTDGGFVESMSWLKKTVREVLGGNPFSEQHLHSLVDDTLGGFTVSEDFRAQVIKALAGFSVVRASGARVINTSKPGVTFPTIGRALTNAKQYSSDLTQGDSNWKPEGFTSGGTARTPQNKPTFGQERIPVHIWQPDPVEITQELISDTDVDLEGILAELFGETMAMDTDLAFLKGNPSFQPEGILSGGSSSFVVADASTYASPAANDNGFSYPRLVNFFHDLAAQYRRNSVWYMNSTTYGRILAIEASDGHPIFTPNMNVGTLWNRPIFFTEFLDNGNTVGNFPILLGDPRYYVIVERRAMSIMRLMERYAPNVALLPTARIGGQLVLKEAFRLGSVQS